MSLGTPQVLGSVNVFSAHLKNIFSETQLALQNISARPQHGVWFDNSTKSRPAGFNILTLIFVLTELVFLKFNYADLKGGLRGVL